jgi:hypothetical protein
MSTNRLFTLLVLVAFTAVIAFSVRMALATTGRTYQESIEQVVRESQLGERYGVLPQSSADSSETKSLREYNLGERYGETPQGPIRFSEEQILQEYILGERYGVTPQGNADQQALRNYWLGERYGVTP